MSIRVSFLAIVWFFAIILLFITPLHEQPELIFQIIPLRSIVHLFMFIGFSHVCIVALKKQFRYASLRSRAIFIVISVLVLIALIAELSVYIFGNHPSFQFWNFGMDIVGVMIGGITFRLLYDSCY